MPEYSLHVEEGNGRQYMIEVSEPDARRAIERFTRYIDPRATTAKIEIVEVLADA